MKLGRARKPEFLPAASSFPRVVSGKSSAKEVGKEGNTKKGEGCEERLKRRMGRRNEESGRRGEHLREVCAGGHGKVTS